MAEQALREEIEKLRMEHAAAKEETNQYKRKFEDLSKKCEDEIEKRSTPPISSNQADTSLPQSSPSTTAAASQMVNSNENHGSIAHPGYYNQGMPSNNCTSNIDVLSQIRQEASTAITGLNALQQSYGYIDYNLGNVMKRLSELEQYSRINSLLFYGFVKIPKDKHGRALREFLVDELNRLFPSLEGGPVLESEIEFGHSLKSRSKKHVVIIKFRCRFTRNAIYYSKKSLPTDCGISIREHLTFANKTLVTQAIDAVGPKNVWTSQTKIFAKVNGEKWEIITDRDIKDLHKYVGYDNLYKHKYTSRYQIGGPQHTNFG